MSFLPSPTRHGLIFIYPVVVWKLMLFPCNTQILSLYHLHMNKLCFYSTFDELGTSPTFPYTPNLLLMCYILTKGWDTCSAWTYALLDELLILLLTLSNIYLLFMCCVSIALLFVHFVNQWCMSYCVFCILMKCTRLQHCYNYPSMVELRPTWMHKIYVTDFTCGADPSFLLRKICDSGDWRIL